MIQEWLINASIGMDAVTNHVLTFLLFGIFVIWASVQDIKTMTIKNYQNGMFLLVGIILAFLHHYHIFPTGLNLGYGHVLGMAVGFFVLFIPGMILNFAFGGDIKFIAAMGFWIGPAAILFLLFLSVFIQLFFLLGKMILNKTFNTTLQLPFAPSFGLAFLIAIFIL